MSVLAQVRAAPNLLTLLRLFSLPFLVIAILDSQDGNPSHWHVAFGLILFAGITDALDGQIARRFHQATTLGLYLDPIADKLLLSTLFITLTMIGDIPRHVTVLVFSRDLGILLIATLLFATNTLRDFRPSFLGKVNTFIQIIAVGGLMAWHVFGVAFFKSISDILLVGIAWLAPISAAQYAWLVVARIGAVQPTPPTSKTPASGPQS